MNRLIILIACCTALLTTGCTALRFGYNQAPTLAYWWLDGYVDLDSAQGERTQAALDTWFRWHRREALPIYAQQLEQVAQQALAPTTPERFAAEIRADMAKVGKLIETAGIKVE